MQSEMTPVIGCQHAIKTSTGGRLFNMQTINVDFKYVDKLPRLMTNYFKLVVGSTKLGQEKYDVYLAPVVIDKKLVEEDNFETITETIIEARGKSLNDKTLNALVVDSKDLCTKMTDDQVLLFTIDGNVMLADKNKDKAMNKKGQILSFDAYE